MTSSNFPPYLASFVDASFLERYDAFFLDVWGTLSDGVRFYPEAIPFLDRVLEIGKRIVLVSNSSRSHHEARAGYLQKGLPNYGNKLWVVTAGQTCINDIGRGLHGQRFYAYGHPVSLPSGYVYVQNLDDADAVIVAMCNTADEDGMAPHQDFLDLMLQKHLPIVCANADQWVYDGGLLYMCAGHITRHYEAMGGQVTFYGKPHKAMFEEAHKLCGLDIPYNRILMVGDSFETDIQGAYNYGTHSCVVLTGLYNRASNMPPEDWIRDQSRLYNGVLPTYWSHHVS